MSVAAQSLMESVTYEDLAALDIGHLGLDLFELASQRRAILVELGDPVSHRTAAVDRRSIEFHSILPCARAPRCTVTSEPLGAPQTAIQPPTAPTRAGQPARSASCAISGCRRPLLPHVR